MMDRIDIDEKWWFMTRVNNKYYLVPDKKGPHRTCKHKGHILKIMALAASARPRQNPVTGEWWDGKIGMWWFGEWEAAVCSSRNRPAGTPEFHPVKVNKNKFVEMCIENLLPAIKEKWPAWCPKRIHIQQDGATPHPKPGSHPLLEAELEDMRSQGWNIGFITQPPNSPDTNTKDLAFFCAIQSIQHEKLSTNVTELMTNVEEAFKELSLSPDLQKGVDNTSDCNERNFAIWGRQQVQATSHWKGVPHAQVGQ